MLAGVAVGGVVATRTTGHENDAPRYRGSLAVVASPQPDFALRDQDGSLVRSRELRGKVTLLTFLDTKCTAACAASAVDRSRGTGQVRSTSIFPRRAEMEQQQIEAFR